MWQSQSDAIAPNTMAIKWANHQGALTVGEVIAHLKDNEKFRTAFTESIANCRFRALFWEMPPVTRGTLNRPFECVCVEGRALESLQPDPAPFARHFSENPMETVLTFPNLGGDAELVVPAPIGEPENYPHLARFLRRGPRDQIDTFWQSVGHAMDRRVSDKPVWLSTAGMGVSWLHLRLDSRPKYYRHAPYKACL